MLLSKQRHAVQNILPNLEQRETCMERAWVNVSKRVKGCQTAAAPTQRSS